MEEVKFYMDEHIHPGVTAGLRRRGVNVVTAQDFGMSSATDEEHLQFAVKEGRVILTQDEDFLAMHATGIPHCGIVFVPQHTPVGKYRARTDIATWRTQCRGHFESSRVFVTT